MIKTNETIQTVSRLKEAKNNFHDPSKFLTKNDDEYYSTLYT